MPSAIRREIELLGPTRAAAPGACGRCDVLAAKLDEVIQHLNEVSLLLDKTRSTMFRGLQGLREGGEP